MEKVRKILKIPQVQLGHRVTDADRIAGTKLRSGITGYSPIAAQNSETGLSPAILRR
jgi:hypothetical protein